VTKKAAAAPEPDVAPAAEAVAETPAKPKRVTKKAATKKSDAATEEVAS
jgi:hypothetical protein